MRKAPFLSRHYRRCVRLGVVCAWSFLSASLIAAEAAEAPADEAAPAVVTADASAAAALPTAVHGGRLLRLERLDTAVACIDMEQAIAAGHIEAGSGDSALEAERAPAAGTCFAVAVFELDRGRSLSKVDYRLEVDGQAFDGIAMALGEAAFDPRRQVVTEPGVARVLFAVPSDAERVSLAPALLTTVPMRAVREIAFAAPAASADAAAPPEAAVAPEAAPTTAPKTDDTTAAKTNDAPAAQPKAAPAAKTDDKAKPAPAVAPKTDKPAGAKADAFEF